VTIFFFKKTEMVVIQKDMATDEAQEHIFQKLRAEYQQTIPAKLQAMRQLVDSLQKTRDLQTLKELYGLVHKITGSSGVYGFMRTSEIAKKWGKSLSQMIDRFPHSVEGEAWILEVESYMQQIAGAFDGKK
jgi:HPt (histidine-containing phosphotransfer) domain-containing protein